MREKRRKIVEEDIEKVFCTECGEELDDLAFSPDGDDLEAALERFHKCREKGKFNGDVCARVFIVDEENFNREDIGS